MYVLESLTCPHVLVLGRQHEIVREHTLADVGSKGQQTDLETTTINTITVAALSILDQKGGFEYKTVLGARRLL